MNLRDIGYEGEDWIHVVQDRDELQAPGNTVTNLRVP